MTENGHSLGDYAHIYATNHHLEVFPLNPDKTPRTPSGMKDASDDPGIIAAWWRHQPDSLIGCRIPDHVIVLDVDPRHRGDEQWEALTTEHGPAPATRRHRSGRNDGGFHIWLNWPHDRRPKIGPLKQWLVERDLHVVETRPDGREVNVIGVDLLTRQHRYTVLPPSPHPITGQPYEWVDTSDVADCPDWLAELLTDSPPPAPTNTTLAPAASSTPAFNHRTSPADWFTANTSWTALLGSAGWHVVAGDGDSDGSKWRRPGTDNPFSATIRHGLLFVYSTATEFEPTLPGDPAGYTPFRAWAELQHRGDLSAAARAVHDDPRYQHATGTTPDTPAVATPASEPHTVEQAYSPFIDWADFWQQDHMAEDWLLAPVIARGRLHAITAAAKAGKSLLSLEMAAALASGRPFLDKPASEPTGVLYIDYEMTSADLHERLVEFGYGPDDDLEQLRYMLLPQLPPLTDPRTGHYIAQLAIAHQVELVVIDTLSRAHQGDEDRSEPIREIYQSTVLPLKSAGIAVLRLDHTGKDATKGSRGTSAKNDDVDIGWVLTADGDTLKLKAQQRRMGWVPHELRLERHVEAPMHRYAPGQRSSTWDPLQWLDNIAREWVTTKEAATAMTGSLSPDRMALQKARRAMQRHVDTGDIEVQVGTGTNPSMWRRTPTDQRSTMTNPMEGNQ